jgi:hypothetical protein
LSGYLGFEVINKASWQALMIYPNYLKLLGQLPKNRMIKSLSKVHDQERGMELFLPWHDDGGGLAGSDLPVARPVVTP